MVAQSGYEPPSLPNSPTLSGLTLMNLGRPLPLSSVMHRISSVGLFHPPESSRGAGWAIRAQQTPSAATSSMRLVRSGSDRRLSGHPLRLGLPSIHIIILCLTSACPANPEMSGNRHDSREARPAQTWGWASSARALLTIHVLAR